MIKSGQVTVNGKQITRPDAKLRKGQSVEISRKRRTNSQAKPVSGKQIDILHQDESIIVAVKPAGVISAGKGSKKQRTFTDTLSNQIAIAEKEFQSIFPVKRLDKEVSGIMVFARSEKIHRIMRSNWKSYEKRYCTLVEGAPAEDNGSYSNFIKVKRSGGVMIMKSGRSQQKATTVFKVLKRFSIHTLIELRPETEIKHQLRIQLAKQRLPIVGDFKYGSRDNQFGRLALHLHFLKFIHPVSGKEIKITTAYPKQFMSYARKA